MKSEAIRRCIGIAGNRVSGDVTVDCPYTAAAAEAELTALKARIDELETENKQHRETWTRLVGGDETTDEERAIFRSIFGPSKEEQRIEELEEALNRIASWDEGAVVTGSFDEPVAARTARSALANVGRHPTSESPPPSGGKSSMVEVPIEWLRENEWGVPAGREGEWMCPVCDAFEVDGHSPDCWLGNLLRSSEAAEEEG